MKALNGGESISIVTYGTGPNLKNEGNFTLTVTLYQKPLGLNCREPIYIKENEKKSGMTLYLGEKVDLFGCGSHGWSHGGLGGGVKGENEGENEGVFRGSYYFLDGVFYPRWIRIEFLSSFGSSHQLIFI